MVSLELRASAVTERADVVLPVAAGRREGRHLRRLGGPGPRRSTRRCASPTRCPTCRVLAGIADEMGVDLGCRDRRRGPRPRCAELGAWDGDRAAAAPTVARGRSAAARPTARRVLATWQLLLDDGRLQDGETVPRGHRAHAGRAGVRRDRRRGSASADGEPVTRRGRARLGHAAGRGRRPARRRGLGADELAGSDVRAPTCGSAPAPGVAPRSQERGA